MIANDHELQVTLERIARFQAQVAHLRQVEAHPANYHAAASGFLAEIDRMQLGRVCKVAMSPPRAYGKTTSQEPTNSTSRRTMMASLCTKRSLQTRST